MRASGRLSAATRLPLVLLGTLAILLTIASQVPTTQAPVVAVPDTVLAQIAADGSAPVIVGVRAPFVPEGNLAGPADVALQRDAIQVALDSAMGRAQAAGAVLGGGFQTIPFFNARVDAGALAALRAMPDVVSIEADALVQPLLAQSVPLINAPAAWTAGHTGTGWRVAIVDTGVEKTHGFLLNKVVQEACYSNANGAGTGTTTCPGGVTSSTAVGSGVPCTAAIGSCDHGTHVAGIAAGANGPGGINGAAPGADLFAMQVFTIFTGSANCGSSSPCISVYFSDIDRALERAFLLTGGPANDNRLASVNMSLGGGNPSTNCDATNLSTKAAIDNLVSRGVATVIASGNNGFTTGISAPACISTAVSVGSTTKTPESISSFTNRGGGLPLLMAPGGLINASVVNNLFGVKSGTSMATPHVAGAWAVLKQAVPAAGVAQVVNALRTTGTTVGGFPRINVNAARLALGGGGGGGVPGAPGTPTISGSGNTVNINWTAPLTGGAATSYTVIARLVAGGPVVATLPVGAALGTSVPAPNGTFHVTVQASNASGPGPESAGVTFNVPIVAPPPGAPTGLAVTVVGDRATFTWTPPTTGGTATGYTIVAALTAGGAPIAALPFGAPATGVIVTGVPPGTYFVKLAATNSGGTSPFSNEVTVNVAGPQVPGAPTLNPAVVTGPNVALSWAPGGGGTATSFLIVASFTPGGAPIASLPVGGTAITVPAPPGTYFVRIHGVNGVGTGPASNEITVVVP